MPLQKVLLFYNPHAGHNVFSGQLDTVIQAFQEKDQIVVSLRADRRELLDEFFEGRDMSEYAKILVAGGDGTVNTMVTAMVKYDLHIPLAIFPAGTANDLAHYFDLPSTVDEMLTIATGEHYTEMDVGMANDRCFVNVMALGVMVDVSQKTDPVIKNTMGVMAYYLRGVADMRKLKPIPITITSPVRSEDLKMYAMIIMNGRSAGGFKRAAPEASINDGMLDVIIFRKMPIINLAGAVFSVLSGQHTANKNVLFFRTPELIVESPEDLSTDVDGEAGPGLPLHLSVLRRRLKICTLKDDMEGNEW
ncbi:MAG: YegS/Rv2252/BmrU family lipid kinase [Clostridiales Family XIII bacterium]|jgi:YegS/Rv2252/BmrU family lipid kinase|nr:YegS/Rv2252/BmrU family lipid kinase [Clostridiales Family XIII bacterium]